MYKLFGGAIPSRPNIPTSQSTIPSTVSTTRDLRYTK